MMNNTILQSDKPSMRSARLFYFFFFAGAASLLPFLVLYYEGLGFNGRQIGILAAIPPLVVMFGAPLWSGLADATQRHKQLLLLAIWGSIVTAFILSKTELFLLLIPVVIVYAFFSAPIIPLVDNTVLFMLAKRSDEYGKQRLWGAVGWGIIGPVAGMLIEYRGISWSFYGYIILTGVCLLLARLLPITPSHIKQNFWDGVGTFLENSHWRIFLFVIFLSGIGMSIVHNFLFLYLDVLGASKTLMGVALMVATFSEVIFFFFSDRLLKRYGSPRLLVVGLAAAVVRVLAYSFIREPSLVLVVQLLHGLAFAMMWSASVAYANAVAPSGLGATAQGLLTGVYFGLGAAVGALLGGFLFDAFGPLLMYRWTGVVVLAGLFLFILTNRKNWQTLTSQHL